MKIMDRNGRLFGKISIIDVAVILVVAIMAVALYTKNNTLAPTASTGSDTTITFTALAENLEPQIADAVAIGDKVYDYDHSSGGAIGKIVAIERQSGSKTEKLSNRTFATLTNEDGYNLLITVECSGRVVNGRYSINRVYELGVNGNRKFYTPYVIFNSVIVDIH